MPGRLNTRPEIRPQARLRPTLILGGVAAAVVMAWLLTLFTLTSGEATHEGTLQVAPHSGSGGDMDDIAALLINWGAYGEFSKWGSTDTHARLHIRIADPAREVVYLGFSRASYQTLTNSVTYNLKFRIMDPLGREVYSKTVKSNNEISRAQALAGPNTFVGVSGGYTPFTFTPGAGAPAGDYYLEFKLADYSSSYGFLIHSWDIAVADVSGGSPVAKPGRVWSRNWAFYCPDHNPPPYFDRPFNGSFYVLQPAPQGDYYVSRINFDGANFRPAAFNIAFNHSGTTQTGNVVADRRSREGAYALAPEHMVFLNDPDPAIWPSGTFGEVETGSVELRRCDSTAYCIRIVATQPGQVDVLLDLSDDTNGGTTGLFDPHSRDVIIAEVIPNTPNGDGAYEVCVDWDGRDGQGQLLQAGSEMDRMRVFYSQGVIHFPIFDAEFNVNGFAVENVRPEVPGGLYEPMFFWDDSEINAPPTDPNTVNPPVRPQVQLDGCLGNCRTWDYLSGSAPYGYGNVNTLNTWWFTNRSAFDVTALSIPDFVQIEVGEALQFTCQGRPIALQGQVAYSSGGNYGCSWSGGSGTFLPSATQAQATYHPAEAEFAAGSVDLTLSAQGGCVPPAKTVTYMFTEDVDICANGLPVEWAYIQAVPEGGDGLLSWGTATELNSHYFEVERALDQTTFVAIGRVEAAGQASELRRYQHRDPGIVSQAQGPVYYRLRQVDIDGSFAYSPVAELLLGASASGSLRLFPNPAREAVTLEVALPYPDQPARLVVLDLQGRSVHQQALQAGTLRLSLGGWAPGTYLARIENGGQLLTEKLIVQ